MESVASGTPHTHDSQRGVHSVIVRMTGTFLGGALVLNAFILDGFRPGSGHIADISALVGALLLAAPLALISFRNLKHGRLSMEELATLAIFGCFASEQYKVAGVVAFFMLMAELIQQRTALGARAAIEALLHLTPRRARTVDAQGHEHDIDASELQPGMTLRVRPGENIPADGHIVRGTTTLNEATITGESMTKLAMLKSSSKGKRPPYEFTSSETKNMVRTKISSLVTGLGGFIRELIKKTSSSEISSFGFFSSAPTYANSSST